MKELTRKPEPRLLDFNSCYFKCPKCGADTDSYDEPYGARWCRECELIWVLTDAKHCPKLTSTRLRRPKGKRTYEIIITHATMFVDAPCNEEARRIAVKMLKKAGITYPIFIKYRWDNAECNEGIPI